VKASVVAVILRKIGKDNNIEKEEDKDKRVVQEKKNKEEELFRGYRCLNSASK